MLARLCRIGSSRHRLRKCVVVVGPSAADVARGLVASVDSNGVRVVPMGAARRQAAPVGLDTGMRWAHDPAARGALLADVAAALAHVSARAAERGCFVMPPGVGAPPCGDDHMIEVFDPGERLPLHHSLSNAEPVILALSGRSQVGPNGVSGEGSRRLATSTEHVAPLPLPSLDPTYLRHWQACLRQQTGLRRLEHMDVNPLGEAGEVVPHVSVRYCDAQMLLSTVRAYIILFQAIGMRARRHARDGSTVPVASVEDLARRRAAAVTLGCRARLRHDGALVPAAAAFAALLEDLCPEFYALEVEPSEMEPLTLGPSLRAAGLRGLRNEDDLLRDLCQRSGAQVLRVVQSTFPHQEIEGVAAANLRRWPVAGAMSSRAWAVRLRQADASRPLDRWQQLLEVLRAGRVSRADLRIALLNLGDEEACHDLAELARRRRLDGDAWGTAVRQLRGATDEVSSPHPTEAVRIVVEGEESSVLRRAESIAGADCVVFRLQHSARRIELVVVPA